MILEKEENQRLIDIYRQSNESLETINKRLKAQIEDLNMIIDEKDAIIKELREE